MGSSMHLLLFTFPSIAAYRKSIARRKKKRHHVKARHLQASGVSWSVYGSCMQTCVYMQRWEWLILVCVPCSMAYSYMQFLIIIVCHSNQSYTVACQLKAIANFIHVQHCIPRPLPPWPGMLIEHMYSSSSPPKPEEQVTLFMCVVSPRLW